MDIKTIMIAIAVMFLSAACSSDKKAKPASAPANKPAQETPKADVAPADESKRILLNANDMMKFDKDKIEVNAGQKIRLTLKHTGKMTKEAMGHNFVLLKPGTDVSSFANKCLEFKDQDYLPPSAEEVIVATKMLGGGEFATIEFEAPEAGTYTYICTFPGHWSMMKGELVVK